MAIAHVQSKKAYGTGDPINIAFDSNVAAGALIVVTISRYGGAIVNGITDTRGNSYTRVAAELLYTNDNSLALDTWYAYNSTAGANTVSIDFAAASNASVAIHEYSGALTTDPLDKVAQNAAVGTGANPVTSTATTTTAQADEMLFGHFVGDWGDSQTITADTDAGFTLRQTYGDGLNFIAFGSEDRDVSSTGTYAATFNRTNNKNGLARVVTFKAAAGATNITPAEATQSQTSDAAILSILANEIIISEATQAQQSDVPTLTFYPGPASVGPVYPGSTSSAAVVPYDDLDWVNWGNVVADDTSYGSITSASFDAGSLSYVGYTYNFNAGVPTMATINGVYAEIGKYYSAGSARDAVVSLINGLGSPIGNNLGSTGIAWPTSIGTVGYGGSTNTWGTTLTPAIVNGTGFGVRLVGSAVANNTDIWVDFIRLTVYYTPTTTLVQFQPADASQTQVMDIASIEYTSGNTITPAEATQGQTSDAAIVNAVYLVSPAEASQAQSSDAAPIGFIQPIAPTEASQGQTSDPASITVIYVIASAEASQTQSSDAASPTTITPIAPSEASQGQNSDAATPIPIYVIVPAEATQNQLGDAASLGQYTTISPTEAIQSQTSDAVTLAVIYPLAPAEAAQTQASDAALISFSAPGEATQITPAEASQTQTSDAAQVKAVYLLTAGETTQGQASDPAQATAIYPLAVSEANQSQTSDAAAIDFTAPTWVIAPAEASQSQTVDPVTLAVIYLLAGGDASQAQISDTGVLTIIGNFEHGARGLYEMSTRGASNMASRSTHDLAVRDDSVFAARPTHETATRGNLEVDD